MSHKEMQVHDDHLAKAEGAQSSAETSEPKDLSNLLVSAHELQEQHELETANELLQQALALIEALPAEEHHPHLAEVLWNIANNLYNLSLVDDCIPYFQRLVTVQEERLGSEDSALITPLLRLAIALKRSGQAEDSEAVFQRSMSLAKQVNPDGQLSQGPSANAANAANVADAEVAPSVTPAVESTTFVHPNDESVASKAQPKADADADVLKYLFSDKSPLQAADEQSDENLGDGNLAVEPEAAPFRFVESEHSKFADRNPAATRLSAMDLAALGAIPSPQAMKTMFRDVAPPLQDIGARTKATAYLKANEGSDEPVKFADTIKNFEGNEAAPFAVRYPWAIPTVAAVLVLFIAGYFVRDYLDHAAGNASWDESINPNALKPIKTFTSFDKLTALNVFDGDKAIYQSAGRSSRAKCFFLDGDPRDFAAAVPGSYAGRHMWFEENSGGLRTSDGIELYLADAPMSMVVKQMELVADRVQEFYKQNHTYPTSAEQFQAALGNAVSHMNPITHKGDSPKFYNTYSSSLAASAAKLEDKTAAGESWINETSMAPGEIHCCSLIYEDPSGRPDASAMAASGATAQNASQNTSQNTSLGTATHFFIRGGDTNSQFIPGSKAGTAFYIKLSDGKSNTTNGTQNVAEAARDFSKLRILIAKSLAEESFFMFIAGAIPAILIMVIGACWVITNGLHDQKDQEAVERKTLVKRLLIGASVILGLWIFMCSFG